MRHDDLKAFLDQVGDYRCRVRRCEYQIAALQSKCEKSTSAWRTDGGGGSAGSDIHKEANLISLCEKRDMLVQLLEEQSAAVASVENFISLLPDYRHRVIMQMRYVDLLRWSEISSELEASGLPYSERQMYNLHGSAIKAARKLWDERCKCDDET